MSKGATIVAVLKHYGIHVALHFTGEFGQRASIYHFVVDSVSQGFEELAATIEENVNNSRRY